MSSVVMATSSDDELIKDELITMYKIIMNDPSSTCVIATEDRPIIDILQNCIGLMVEKFKGMSEHIKEIMDITIQLNEANKKLEDENEELKDENRKLDIQNDEYDTGFLELYGILEKHDIMEDTTPKLMEMLDIVDKTINEKDKENKKIGELVISQTDKLKEVSIKYNEGSKTNEEIISINEKMKEMNNEMAKENAQMEIRVKEAEEGMLNLALSYSKVNGQAVKDMIELQKEIDELKEENEELKK
jgi:cell division protein FtsB